MRRYFFSLLLILITCSPAMATSDTSGPWGIDASRPEFKNLSTCLSSPLTVGQTIVIRKPMSINNKTVTGNRLVKVIPPGRIDTNSGKTLAFALDSDFDSGGQQAFGGTGTVTGLKMATPRMFGAKGDGSTNDTAAIRKAAASTNYLRIRNGVYLVDGSDTGILITVARSGITIEGDGSGVSVLAPLPGSNGFAFIKTDGVAREQVTVKNLGFTGVSSSRGSGNDYGVWLKNVQNGLVEHCHFFGMHGGASIAVIASAGAKDIMVRTNEFVANDGEDINFYGTEGSIYSVSAIGNTHYQPQAIAIEVEGRNGTTISGYEVYDVVITGETIRSDNASYASSGDHGILLIGARGATVGRTTINRRGSNGINIIGSWNVELSHNIIRDMGATGRRGINLTQDTFGAAGISKNIDINHNIIDGANGYGISAYVGESSSYISQNISFSKNTLANCGTGIGFDNINDPSLLANSYNSNSVNTNIGGVLTGNIHIDDIGNTSSILSLPFASTQKTINQTVDGAITLDISKGVNDFVVWLNANVTAVNISGQEKLGQRVGIHFLQSAGSKTVTNASANWTSNGSANILFPGLTVPTLPGSTVSGRWGIIEFEYVISTGVGLPSSGRWVMVSSQLNLGQ